jgi:multidrug efflux pump
VDVNPTQLASYGLAMSSLQSVLSTENSDLAKGQITNGDQSPRTFFPMTRSRKRRTTSRSSSATKMAPPSASDVANVTDSVQNIRAGGYLNGKRAVTIIIFPSARRQYHRHRRPHHRANSIPSRPRFPFGIDTTIVIDRTTTIRASVEMSRETLVISVILVIAVVFVFLRNGRATLIPGVAVPVSLLGTCAIMYMFGYSIDNLSLDGHDHRHRLRGR